MIYWRFRTVIGASSWKHVRALASTIESWCVGQDWHGITPDAVVTARTILTPAAYVDAVGTVEDAGDEIASACEVDSSGPGGLRFGEM